MGAKHCLATSSCTGALLSALTACGIGPGDECIVTGYTFFASCAAIVGAKAIPVIAEVDETLTIDPADIEKKITPATKGIVCVHMRGVPCDMDAIMAIAKKHDLRVIEDCAQACGATYKGKFVGTFGDCGCFSFQYHKTITAGEGGTLLTNDDRALCPCLQLSRYRRPAGVRTALRPRDLKASCSAAPTSGCPSSAAPSCARSSTVWTI